MKTIYKVLGGSILIAGSGGTYFLIPASHDPAKLTSIPLKSSQTPNTIGSEYAQFFLSTESQDNEDIWNKRSKNFTKKAIKDITFAPKGESDTQKEISTAKEFCELIYKGEKKHIKEAEIWKTCSRVGQSPQFLTESQYTDKKGSEKSGDLLSTADKNNEEIWKIKHHDFENSGEQTGFFVITLEKKTLKDLCQSAYETDKNTPAPGKNAILKFCSLRNISKGNKK